MDREENKEREIDSTFLNDDLKRNPFTVDKNYFNQLQEGILAQIKLSAINKADFSIPETYQENLTQKLLSEVKLAGLKQESSDLFKVPTHYFEVLEEQIISRSVDKKTKIFKLNIIKYASAAVVLLAISFGIYLNYPDNQTVDHQLSTIPDEEIINYLKFHSDANDVNLMIENLDDVATFESDLYQDINQE
ncbi:hypothetical protein [Pedobacter glucosidilyticus]|uniref:hypothetical protein n=1 Tax=Pedobacter glucosidilyticus TaxID=1122941 RepID=UPI0004154C5A|nr:hypothetical protein [Pedobacter glucosidilyticus]